MKKHKKILLVKSIKNWADEMNLGGFAIFTENHWNKHLDLVKKGFSDKDWDGRLGIGSNQELYFKSLADYKKQFKIVELTKLEMNSLIKQFSIKINDGADSKSWEYSHFGVFTAYSEDYISDTLHQTKTGRTWLKANGYKVYD